MCASICQQHFLVEVIRVSFLIVVRMVAFNAQLVEVVKIVKMVVCLVKLC